MCGIAGYYNNNSNFDEINSVISEMNNIQIHRGPNSSDKYFNSKNSLGLIIVGFILDLDLGKQPMSTKDGRYTIIFNGTILNFPILRHN